MFKPGRRAVNENIINENFSYLDMPDSIDIGVNFTTGIEAVGDVVYSVGYIENTISKKNSQNFDFLRTGLNSFLDLKIFNLSTDFLEKYKQNCLEINNQNLNIEMISLIYKQNLKK